jgi:hypothetical protein
MVRLALTGRVIFSFLSVFQFVEQERAHDCRAEADRTVSRVVGFDAGRVWPQQ